jgi:hypothetical protein
MEAFLLWDQISAREAVGSDGTGELGVRSAICDGSDRERSSAWSGGWIENDLGKGTRTSLGWSDSNGVVIGGHVCSLYISLATMTIQR